jgi:hypothetical protein
MSRVFNRRGKQWVFFYFSRRFHAKTRKGKEAKWFLAADTAGSGAAVSRKAATLARTISGSTNFCRQLIFLASLPLRVFA